MKRTSLPLLQRREFITLIGGVAAAGSVLWPLAARAQASPKRPTIAWISGGTRQVAASFIENFLRGMKEFGYVEGRNFDMLYRFTDGYQERLPALTEEVVRLKPDIILATAAISAVGPGNSRPRFRSSRRRSRTRFTWG